MASRLRIFHLLVLVLFGGITARLFYWQVVAAKELRAVAQAQYQRTSELTVARGKIFTADHYPLAINQRVFTVYATPKTLDVSPPRVAALLSPVLFPVKEATLEAQLLARLADSEKSWVSLKRQVTKDQQNQIAGLELRGIGFDPEEIRYYPEGSMAAHLLGFVGKDTQGNPKGYFGVEGRFDLELKGKGGYLSQEADAMGKPIAIGDFQRIETVAARDLTLTIRRDIQNFLEEKLAKGMELYGARSADAIILEPKTGRVLAMAAIPSYDPAHFYDFDPMLYKNPTVADGYEPGSTFKLFTLAAGVDSGAITPETQCTDCGGPKTIGKYTIRTWNEKYYENITMNEALAKSDNTAMMFAADLIGEEKFISYLHLFGFGEKTGIDLQDETSPRLRDDQKWGDIDIATASFGQGIAVTPIQLVNGVNAIANGGKLMRPYIIDRVIAGDTTFVTNPKALRQVISNATATTVTQMMIGSAAHGDAKWALPRGYVIAGKTGTAQIPVGGHYDETRTIASFVGFAPADDPRFTMLVRLTEPQTSQWGSETAAPLWFSIAKDLFVKLGISARQE